MDIFECEFEYECDLFYGTLLAPKPYPTTNQRCPTDNLTLIPTNETTVSGYTLAENQDFMNLEHHFGNGMLIYIFLLVFCVYPCAKTFFVFDFFTVLKIGRALAGATSQIPRNQSYFFNIFKLSPFCFCFILSLSFVFCFNFVYCSCFCFHFCK